MLQTSPKEPVCTGDPAWAPGSRSNYRRRDRFVDFVEWTLFAASCFWSAALLVWITVLLVLKLIDATLVYVNSL